MMIITNKRMHPKLKISKDENKTKYVPIEYENKLENTLKKVLYKFDIVPAYFM